MDEPWRGRGSPTRLGGVDVSGCFFLYGDCAAHRALGARLGGGTVSGLLLVSHLQGTHFEGTGRKEGASQWSYTSK